MKGTIFSGVVIGILLVILLRVALPVHLVTNQFAAVENENKQLPNVLLIGDSTAIRYYPFVRDALRGKANVYRLVEYAPQRLHSLFIGGPLLRPVNGGSTNTGIKMLEEWLEGKEWDIIHFNWGLHDLTVGHKEDYERKSRISSIQEYSRNLALLLNKLEKTGAFLIFATTTPVPLDVEYIDNDVLAYNSMALGLMERHNIMVNDLYNAISPYVDKMQYKNDVHFRESGSRLLAREVVACIERGMELHGKMSHAARHGITAR